METRRQYKVYQYLRQLERKIDGMGEIAKKKKTCVRCKTVYEYESEKELSKYFYKMKDWYKNTCSSCEKKEHSEKYASGDYNYRKKDKKKYDKDVTFGF